MKRSSTKAIEAALRSELGNNVTFSPYGSEHRTPMTFVLDEVRSQIGDLFSVYWVDDNGPPDVFCLPGLSPSPVVFSTRYLSLSAFVRHLFIDSFLKNVLPEVAERTALKLIAEMAMRHGDRELAILLFLKSMVGKSIWLDDSDRVMGLELEPKNEAYMATWFFGLAHELGHLRQSQETNEIFATPVMRSMLDAALQHFPSYPEWVKTEAITKLEQSDTRSVVSAEHLRGEGLADVFAASILFKTTHDIMRIDTGEFRVANYASEMFLALNILALIDRCRRVARLASKTVPPREAAIETALHPVSVYVRALMLRFYLEKSITTYLFDETATSEQEDAISKMLDEVNKAYAESIDLIEKGVARAMEFALFPERRDNEWVLLETFRIESSSNSLGLSEATRFCQLADAVGAEGKFLSTLKRVLADPKQPVIPDPTGDITYFIPWVEGPNGWNRPFGLDTKHGHLVFVFHDQGTIYEAFFGPSAESLKPGYSLKRAVLPVSREERLGPELATHMPEGPFLIVVEGTEEFEKYLRELADDTIWP